MGWSIRRLFGHGTSSSSPSSSPRTRNNDRCRRRGGRRREGGNRRNSYGLLGRRRSSSSTSPLLLSFQNIPQSLDVTQLHEETQRSSSSSSPPSPHPPPPPVFSSSSSSSSSLSLPFSALEDLVNDGNSHDLQRRTDTVNVWDFDGLDSLTQLMDTSSTERRNQWPELPATDHVAMAAADDFDFDFDFDDMSTSSEVAAGTTNNNNNDDDSNHHRRIPRYPIEHYQRVFHHSRDTSTRSGTTAARSRHRADTPSSSSSLLSGVRSKRELDRIAYLENYLITKTVVCNRISSAEVCSPIKKRLDDTMSPESHTNGNKSNVSKKKEEEEEEGDDNPIYQTRRRNPSRITQRRSSTYYEAAKGACSDQNLGLCLQSGTSSVSRQRTIHKRPNSNPDNCLNRNSVNDDSTTDDEFHYIPDKTSSRSSNDDDDNDNDDNNEEEESWVSTCAICLLEYQPGDQISFSHNPKCQKHHFHKDCIIQWLLTTQDVYTNQYTNQCPCCRSNYLGFGDEHDDNGNNSNNNDTPVADLLGRDRSRYTRLPHRFLFGGNSGIGGGNGSGSIAGGIGPPPLSSSYESTNNRRFNVMVSMMEEALQRQREAIQQGEAIRERYFQARSSLTITSSSSTERTIQRPPRRPSPLPPRRVFPTRYNDNQDYDPDGDGDGDDDDNDGSDDEVSLVNDIDDYDYDDYGYSDHSEEGNDALWFLSETTELEIEDNGTI